MARGDLNLSSPPVRAAGYRQMWQYLSGVMPWQEMKDKSIVASRRLAKRQLTWMRSMKGLHFLETDTLSVSDVADEAERLIRQKLVI